MSIVRIRIFYPADPLGIVPGGVDTFIRGLIKWAPDDLRFSLVGMTTDPSSRPVATWQECGLGRRSFDFFPLVYVRNAGGRAAIPLSVRYTLAGLRQRARISRGFDVLEFHRIEPELLFRRDARPKNFVFHQDMAVIRSANSDILWSRAPGLYARLEQAAIARAASAWCVRETGVTALQARYPEQADRIRFVPTWVDDEVFSIPDPARRIDERNRLAALWDLDVRAPWIAWVGRLDKQKNPELLIAAFEELSRRRPGCALIVVGDGVLRPQIEERIRESELGSRVRLLGLVGAQEMARILAAADVFCMTSGYEGMPMAMLEALGSGLPVVTTDVGEVRRVVHPGRNGAIASEHTPAAVAESIQHVLAKARDYGGESAARAVSDFTPQKVLQRLHENYRRLAPDAGRNLR